MTYAPKKKWRKWKVCYDYIPDEYHCFETYNAAFGYAAYLNDQYSRFGYSHRVTVVKGPDWQEGDGEIPVTGV